MTQLNSKVKYTVFDTRQVVNCFKVESAEWYLLGDKGGGLSHQWFGDN